MAGVISPGGNHEKKDALVFIKLARRVKRRLAIYAGDFGNVGPDAFQTPIGAGNAPARPAMRNHGPVLYISSASRAEMSSMGTFTASGK